MKTEEQKIVEELFPEWVETLDKPVDGGRYPVSAANVLFPRKIALKFDKYGSAKYAKDMNGLERGLVSAQRLAVRALERTECAEATGVRIEREKERWLALKVMAEQYLTNGWPPMQAFARIAELTRD